MLEQGGEPAQLLLTIPQAARVLAIGRTTMYRLIAAGDIAVVKIGRSARIPIATIGEFVDARHAQRRVMLHASSPSDSPPYRARPGRG